MAKDTFFKTLKKVKGTFTFDEKTARDFDDILTRSVPFYSEIQRMIVELVKSFVSNNSNVYDMGCSTAITLINLSKDIDKKQIKLIGIDSSEAMLKRAKNKIIKNDALNRCVLIKADLAEDFKVNNASVVIMSLTLQFIDPAKRDFVVSKIFNGLRRNGCFILIEKILSANEKFNRKFTELYDDFKMRNNYSKLEISKKREALKNVLIPYTYDENITLLRKNGFKSVDGFFRWYNFCGIIAVKK